MQQMKVIDLIDFAFDKIYPQDGACKLERPILSYSRMN